MVTSNYIYNTVVTSASRQREQPQHVNSHNFLHNMRTFTARYRATDGTCQRMYSIKQKRVVCCHMHSSLSCCSTICRVFLVHNNYRFPLLAPTQLVPDTCICTQVGMGQPLYCPPPVSEYSITPFHTSQQRRRVEG